MQIDMHYYGTYAMARAAGLRQESAQIIAQCAQFVDDAAENDALRFDDGGAVYCEPTAHHPGQAVRQYFTQEISHDDSTQREIWIPFHFLPGNAGDTFSEKLKCRKNSIIAQKMVSANLNKSKEAFGLHLIGITAHVFADTFSHYGFSGVSSRSNAVKSERFQFSNVSSKSIAYLEEKKDNFLDNSKSWLLDNYRSWISDGIENVTGALGHGAVMTYPDLPYLKWSFEYENDDQPSERNNPDSFLSACQALHGMFRTFASRCESIHLDDQAFVQFEDMRSTIKDILSLEAGKSARSNAWKAAIENKSLFGRQETCPEYNGENWLTQLLAFKEGHSTSPSEEMITQDLYHFFQAARYHRTYVLRDLLPDHGLAVA